MKKARENCGSLPKRGLVKSAVNKGAFFLIGLEKTSGAASASGAATPSGAATASGSATASGAAASARSASALEWLRVYAEHPSVGDVPSLAGKRCRFEVAKGAVKDFLAEGEPICALRDGLDALGWVPRIVVARRRSALKAIVEAAAATRRSLSMTLVVESVLRNPFIAMEVDAEDLAISVEIAAGLALSAGVPKAEVAVLAARHAVRSVESAGHVCFPRAGYGQVVATALGEAKRHFSASDIERGVAQAVEQEFLVVRGEMLYGLDMFGTEQLIRRFLAKCSAGSSGDSEGDRGATPNAGDRGASGFGVSLGKEQMAAAKGAVTCYKKRGVMVLSGGAGVGKSRTVGAVVAAIGADRVILSAPTGKAARRLERSVADVLNDSEAPRGLTLHRLLGIGCTPALVKCGGGGKSRDEVVAQGQLLVVDEASMVDVRLMRRICEAATRHGLSLMFVGDPHQLPSVGPGRVLDDLVDWAREAGAHYSLTDIYRQGEASPIAAFGKAVVDGDAGACAVLLSSDSEEISLVEPGADGGLEKILEAYAAAADLLPCDVQVISARRDGPASVSEINEGVVFAADPYRATTPWGAPKVVPGDKVVVTKNASLDDIDMSNAVCELEEDLSPAPPSAARNGDIGRLAGFASGGLAAVEQPDGSDSHAPAAVVVAYAADVEHGHAVTVHKFQGCEADTVIFAVHRAHQRMLYSNLIYTAVTRARRRLVIVGKLGVLLGAISAPSPERHSGGFRPDSPSG